MFAPRPTHSAGRHRVLVSSIMRRLAIPAIAGVLGALLVVPGASAANPAVAAASPSVVTAIPVPPSSAPKPATRSAMLNDTGTNAVIYVGTWRIGSGTGKYRGDDHYSDEKDSTVTVLFTGSVITVIGAKAPWHGIAAYKVDTGAEIRVDLYAATRADQQQLFTVKGLSAGDHTLTIRATGARRSASTGTVVAFDGARVTTAVPVSPPAPVINSFVTRSGNQLMLGGSIFRFAGANMYWLGLDDNLTENGQPTYPTKARIDNALTSAQSLGLTVVRSHTLGISVGCAKCFEPNLGVFNAGALASADYAIYRAGQLGIKLMIPLTDQWRWFHGGISTFTGWKGYPNYGGAASNVNNIVNASNNADQRRSESAFYTDSAVRNDFKEYVGRLLEHVNPYTALAYKNDPAIMAWETGNEVWTATPEWTADIATYIKEYLGAKQLVADGSAADGMHVANAAVTATNVDILGGHFYPVDTGWLKTDAAVAAANNKVYIVGEYDWTDLIKTKSLYSAVQTDRNVAGAMLWTMLPYQEDGTPEIHGTPFAFYSPATTTAMGQVVSALAAHAAVMARG